MAVRSGQLPLLIRRRAQGRGVLGGRAHILRGRCVGQGPVDLKIDAIAILCDNSSRKQGLGLCRGSGQAKVRKRLDRKRHGSAVSRSIQTRPLAALQLETTLFKRGCSTGQQGGHDSTARMSGGGGAVRTRRPRSFNALHEDEIDRQEGIDEMQKMR